MNIPDDIKALCLKAGAREDCPHWQRAAIAAYLATGDWGELMFGSQSIAPFSEEAWLSPWFGFSDALFDWVVHSALGSNDAALRAVVAHKRLRTIPFDDP